MSNLNLSLSTVLRYIKIRFVIISLLMIVGVVVIPYWLPIVPDFEPVYSINSDHSYGHSNLLPGLDSYEIEREHMGRTERYSDADLVIITKPQLDISDSYFQQIRNKYEQGTKFLIIGSEKLEAFYEWEGLSVSNQRIFDKTNNGGDRFLPELDAYGLSEIYGVVPRGITITDEFSEINENSEVIITMDTSGQAWCIESTPPCQSIYPIGIIQPDIGFIADQWMFRNEYTDLFPNNIDLFNKVIQDMIGNSGSILFDESHLEWAPLNTEGVENFIEIQFNSGMIIGFILIIGLILPLLIGVQANVFGGKKDNSYSEDFDTLERRLDFVHIERLPSAPLNLMEKTLMDDRLKYEIRGKYFFQYAAQNLLDFIQDHDLQEVFPSQTYENLSSLASGLYSENSSWRVLESAYKQLLSIQNNLVK